MYRGYRVSGFLKYVNYYFIRKVNEILLVLLGKKEKEKRN